MKNPQMLRPYQTDCINADLLDLAAGKKAVLNALATGAGKTTILAQDIHLTTNPKDQRAMVIAHTEELIYQPYERVYNQCASFDDFTMHKGRLVPTIGIVMASHNSADARIVVASRQSLHKKRLEHVLSYGPIDRLYIDEAHHVAPGNTYIDIVQAVWAANPHAQIIGCTATPKRTDNKALGVLFEKISYTWSILDGIAGGYLVPATRKRIRTGVDLTGVKMRGGDYDERQLVSVLEASNWMDLAIDSYEDNLKGRQTLAFFPQVAMSRVFVARCIERGIAAAHVDGETPKSVRAEVLKRYQAGDLVLLSNYNVFTEGLDAPATSGILDARSSSSEVVKTQMFGRGLRLYPGKNDCLIISLATDDTRVVEDGTLLGKTRECWKCKAEFFHGFKACPLCGAPVITLLKEKDEEEPEGIRDVVTMGGKRGVMAGLHEEIVPLLGSMNAAWYKDDHEVLSVGLDFEDGAFVIVPPTWQTDKSTRLRERIQTGMYLLNNLQPGPFYAETKQDYLDFLETLRRELDRTEQYTLWYINRDGSQIEYLKANSDLACLIIQADSDILRKAGPKARNQVDKNAPWRFRPAKEKQGNWARGLARKHGIALPDLLTSGLANQIITHCKYVPLVLAHIEQDCLAEPEEEKEVA